MSRWPWIDVAGQRPVRGWIGVAARVAAITLPLLTVLVAFTGWFDTITRRSGHLAFAIPLVFLFCPASRPRDGQPSRLPVADVGLAALALLVFAWPIVDRERIMWRLVYVDPVPWLDLVFGTVAVLLVLEATRRTLGWTLVWVALVFVAYAFAGPLMPGMLEHRGVAFPMLVEHLYLVPEGLFNAITGVMATFLLIFLMFGTLLRYAGGDRVFTELTRAATARSVGGPAKAEIVGSALVGTVTGSTIATLMTTATVTIPLMIRSGYRPVEAAAIASAASTGGAIVPPVMGAGVFIMAEITQIPLLTILGYSILPAIVYYAGVYAYVHVKAHKRGMMPVAPERDTPTLGASIRRGIHLLLPLGLLVFMLARDFSPFFAASATVVALFLVSFLRTETRLDLGRLAAALEVTTREALVLSATSAIAAVVLGVITISGLMLKVTALTLALAQGSLLIGVAIIALLCLVLGFGLPVTSCYILVAALGAPALVELGLTPLAAHLIVFWCSQTATLTPPVCMTAFVAARLAGAPPMRTGFEAMSAAKGFWLVPLLFAYTQLLSGDWVRMVVDATAGAMWLAMFPVVAERYWRGTLGPVAVGGAAVAGVAFFLGAFSTTLGWSATWLALGLGLVAALWLAQGRRAHSLAAPEGETARP